MSGHGFMIGCQTVNIIGFRVKSKVCYKCSMANSLNVAVEEHGCKINWEGVSGGMEAGVNLELCIALHDESKHRIFVEYIILDDDSTMRAHLTHDGKGKLLPHTPVLSFLADPSHRTKVISAPIFALEK